MFALLACLLAGCGGRPDYTPPQAYPIKGKVILPGGQLLRFGRVMLHAKGKDSAGEPWGDIAKDGTFQITSFKVNDGAVPGPYVVTLHPYSYRSGNFKKDPSSPIPRRYNEPATSDLTVEVKPEPNVVELRLKGR